ncbi:sulfite exporter TauE/SafE family protein [Desulfogranum mediterraneum]|uniref:sulfite exporter TauE/SafE family protein n=1 Tax=Desulfogranum mediterraneum TaxID=160661 RepID=UPI00042944F3|nr:sulfite exporter TauE/SafE family protein [Desulfogranum mediterraneum]
MLSLLLAALIFLLAGFIQGMTGFGAGLVAIPLLCLVVEVKLAVPLVILNGVILTSYMAYRFRSAMDRTRILPLILGTLPGILAGTLLLKSIAPGQLRLLLGIMLIGYSGYNLLARPKPLQLATIWGYLAGFITGTITAMLSAGGPPVIIYTTLSDWSKEQIKATLSGFFFVNSLVAATAHALSGMTTLLTLHYFAVTFPFVLAGTALGALLTDRINRQTYLRLVYLLLIVFGNLLLWG